jgi:tetratricopeptide (TPR) repeat protein
MIETFPHDVHSFLTAIVALKKLRCYGAAEDIVNAANRHFPDSPEIQIAYATLLADRSKWDEAVQAWDQIIEKYPNKTWGWTGKGTTYRMKGDLAAADRVYAEAFDRFPDDAGIAWCWAFICHYAPDWQTAAARWTIYRERWPDDGVGYCGAISAARGLGKLEEAQAIADREGPRFGHLPHFAAEQARLAMAQQDWNQAIDIWERLVADSPEDEGMRGGLAEARLQRTLASIDQETFPAVVSAEAPRGGARNGLSDQDLILQFESLGRDCEFGLLQRALGQETIGLLRWSSSSIPQLIDAMKTRFEKMGQDDTTELVVINDELYFKDRAYGLSMHTFIVHDEKRMDDIKRQMMRRIYFLRRRLIEQFEGAEKIFIYKDNPTSDDSQILHLFEAMQSIAPSRLLVVQRAQSGEVPLTFRKLREGLYVAKIERFGNDSEVWNVPIRSWLKICRSVYEVSTPPFG